MPRPSSRHLRVSESPKALPRHAEAATGRAERRARTGRRRSPALILGLLGVVVAVAAVGLPLHATHCARARPSGPSSAP